MVWYTYAAFISHKIFTYLTFNNIFSEKCIHTITLYKKLNIWEENHYEKREKNGDFGDFWIWRFFML